MYARRAPAATDDTAEDAEEKEATNAAGDADDEVAVVVDPGAHFFCDGGAFALALSVCQCGSWKRVGRGSGDEVDSWTYIDAGSTATADGTV